MIALFATEPQAAGNISLMPDDSREDDCPRCAMRSGSVTLEDSMKTPYLILITAALSFAQPQRQVSRPLTPEQQHAQELADFVKANYTKYEYRIPMRDGKRLFTAVYVPKDFSEK